MTMRALCLSVLFLTLLGCVEECKENEINVKVEEPITVSSLDTLLFPVYFPGEQGVNKTAIKLNLNNKAFYQINPTVFLYDSILNINEDLVQLIL